MTTTKSYKNLKDLPHHPAGDIVYLTVEGSYQWFSSPHYNLDSKMVENSPDFFEEILTNWQEGESIFYITTQGVIQDEEFLAARHIKMVNAGNAFKSKEEAEWYLNQFNKLIKNPNSIVVSRDEFIPIFSALQNKKYKIVKDFIQKFL